MSTEPRKPGTQAAPVPIIAAAPGGASGISAAQALEVDAAIRAIGFIFFNTVNMRWFSASDCRQTIQEGHSVLAAVLGKMERLRLTVSDGAIKVNGDPHETETVHVKALAKHLSSLEGCTFTFTAGVTLVEFGMFMDLICQSISDLKAMGGILEAVGAGNFEHISSKRIVLKEIAEDEVVVSKADVELVTAEGRKRAESAVLSLLSAPAQGAGTEARSEQASSLRKVVQDPEHMADLIMQTVDPKKGDGTTLDKQEVARTVVDCLDRAFAALIDDPFSRTQKGKKAIAGALRRLESELLAKMQVEPAQEEAQQVTTAVERMTERLKMDSIVQEYSKKLKALEDSEKRILRFIKIQGLDRRQDPELEKRLSEEGVDVSDWHRLLAKGQADEGHVALTRLSELLGNLEKDVTAVQGQPGSVSAETITDELRQVNTQVRTAAKSTQVKIDGLVDAVYADMAAVANLEAEAEKMGLLKMPRKRLLAVLAEVVQEIKQPLMVIKCSTDMLKNKALGEVNASQLEILQLTEESAARLVTLIDNLERISGQPKTLLPDRDVQAALKQ